MDAHAAIAFLKEQQKFGTGSIIWDCSSNTWDCNSLWDDFAYDIRSWNACGERQATICK